MISISGGLPFTWNFLYSIFGTTIWLDLRLHEDGNNLMSTSYLSTEIHMTWILQELAFFWHWHLIPLKLRHHLCRAQLILRLLAVFLLRATWSGYLIWPFDELCFL